MGFREDLKTFIGMRGHIANETQPMFNFVLLVALLYIHGSEVLDACIAHMGDAKNEFINTVLSMIAKGGVTPHARLLLFTTRAQTHLWKSRIMFSWMSFMCIPT